MTEPTIDIGGPTSVSVSLIPATSQMIEVIPATSQSVGTPAYYGPASAPANTGQDGELLIGLFGFFIGVVLIIAAWRGKKH